MLKNSLKLLNLQQSDVRLLADRPWPIMAHTGGTLPLDGPLSDASYPENNNHA